MGSISIPCCSHESMSSLASFCVPYSAVGMIFMFWVVMMISKQPLLVRGMEDEQRCKDNAMGALALFIVTFIGSLTFQWFESKTRDRWQQLSTEDPYDLLPRGMSMYNIRTDSELELMGIDTPPLNENDINLPSIS